jgi:hypothetical protein
MWFLRRVNLGMGYINGGTISKIREVMVLL